MSPPDLRWWLQSPSGRADRSAGTAAWAANGSHLRLLLRVRDLDTARAPSPHRHT